MKSLENALETRVNNGLKIIALTLCIWMFSSHAYAQEVRMGFSLGAGFRFFANQNGYDASFTPMLPQINLEVQLIDSIWLRGQLAPYVLVDEIAVDLKYCFFNASNTPYLGFGGGVGLYYMAGLSPIARAFIGYQLDLGAARGFVELVVNPFNFSIGPRLGLATGLTFRL